MENFPRLVSQSDILKRWTFTREGLRLLMKRRPASGKIFPSPVATVNSGRTRLWMLADIEEYERKRPWLTDKKAHERHRRFLASMALRE